MAVIATGPGLDSRRCGLVDARVGLVFGLFGVAAASAGTGLGLLARVVIQPGLFALVMYAAPVRGAEGWFLAEAAMRAPVATELRWRQAKLKLSVSVGPFGALA